MPFPVVDDHCCIDLKKRCFIIGYILLVVAVTDMIYTNQLFFRRELIIQIIENPYEIYTSILHMIGIPDSSSDHQRYVRSTYDWSGESDTRDNKIYRFLQKMKVLFGLIATHMFFSYLFVAFVVILLIGLHGKKLVLLKCYQLYAVVAVFLNLIHDLTDYGAIAISVISFVCNIYCILVVHRLIGEMKNSTTYVTANSEI